MFFPSLIQLQTYWPCCPLKISGVLLPQSLHRMLPLLEKFFPRMIWLKLSFRSLLKLHPLPLAFLISFSYFISIYNQHTSPSDTAICFAFYLFIVCLPPLECKFHKDRNLRLFYSLLYPQNPRWLAHGSHSIHFCWKKWINSCLSPPEREKQKKFSCR